MQRPRRWRLSDGDALLSPQSISLAYSLLSIGWILLSDRLTELIPDRSLAAQIQSIKGVGFVLATTMLLFGLISRHRRRVVHEADQRAAARERRAQLDRQLDTLRPADTPEHTMHALTEALGQLPGVAVAAYLFADEGDLAPMSVSPDAPRPWQLARSITTLNPTDLALAQPMTLRTAARTNWGLEMALAQAGCHDGLLTPVLHEGQLIGLLLAGIRAPFSADEQLASVSELARLAGAWLGPLAAATAERERRRAALLQAGQTLTIVFQPIVDLASGRPVGYEALSRFADGTHPDVRFIEAAELGIGPDLEELAIRRALIEARQLPKRHRLSVNVSVSLLLAEHDRLARLLADADRPVTIELTEREAVADYGTVRAALAVLGPDVRLAIDDVGEGFSGLRHLVELAPAYAKLDLTLVRDIDSDPSRQALVAALHHYLLQTGGHLIAEGVESDAERLMLHSLGVRLAQGFLFGRPASVQELAERATALSNLSCLARRRSGRTKPRRRDSAGKQRTAMSGSA
jgi:EAL domain-containing protein (putative c-di-GMP-specific phosphodiesterase class I)